MVCGKNTKKILMKLKLKAELIEKDFHKRTKIESCQKTFLREKKIKNCAKTRLSFPSCTSCIISKGWGGNQRDSPLFWPNPEDTCPRGFNEPLPSFDPPPPLEGFGGDLTSSPFLLLSSMTWLTGLDSGSVYYWQLVTYLINSVAWVYVCESWFLIAFALWLPTCTSQNKNSCVYDSGYYYNKQCFLWGDLLLKYPQYLVMTLHSFVNWSLCNW